VAEDSSVRFFAAERLERSTIVLRFLERLEM